MRRHGVPSRFGGQWIHDEIEVPDRVDTANWMGVVEPQAPEGDRWVATEVLGWEFLQVGYWGTAGETQRQRELRLWIETVEIESVGEYFVDVTCDWWCVAAEFSPTRRLSDALAALAFAFPDRVWHLQHFPALGGDAEPYECVVCMDGMGYAAGTYLGRSGGDAGAVMIALREAWEAKARGAEPLFPHGGLGRDGGG